MGFFESLNQGQLTYPPKIRFNTPPLAGVKSRFDCISAFEGLYGIAPPVDPLIMTLNTLIGRLKKVVQILF